MYKVVQFIWALGDGGAETLVKDYVLLFDKKQFDVKVLCLYDLQNTANSKHLHDAGFKVYPVFRKHNIPTKIFEMLCGWFYIPFKVLRFLNKEKPDCLHVHLHLLTHLIPIRYKIRGIKLFYTCHNKVDKMVKGKQIKESRILIRDNNMRFIALNEQMRLELNKMFGISNTQVVLNGIDIERFKFVQESKDSIRNSINIPKDAFLLGNIGRFVEQKNHVFLIDIFKEVFSKCPRAHLLLVGDGRNKEIIIEKIKKNGLSDKVTILSHRSDIPRILKAMDVFVFPSLFEGFGIALEEAEIAGIKCVASDVIPPEAVVSDNTIVLSLEKTASDWADVILDPNIKNQIYQDVSNCDIRNSIKKLQNLYLSDSVL